MTVYTAHFEHKALKINIDVDYDTGLERLRAIANPTGAGITDKQRQAMYLARLYLWGEPVDRPVEHGAWMEYVPAVDLAEATAIIVGFAGNKWNGWDGEEGGGGPGGGPGRGGGPN
jgi:hypothetical protein